MKTEPKTKYKIGDVVRVRGWDDMKEQFGRNAFGSIKTPHYNFIKGMSNLCEEELIVIDAWLYSSSSDYGSEVYSVYTLKDTYDPPRYSNITGFYFTDDMLEEESNPSEAIEPPCSFDQMF